ncbi:MAG: tetratricopeptide repeat protein, partial [Spirochaetota bacterium]|nr:tetratricopeptide repeat protein [Spirochaetota bacterium]
MALGTAGLILILLFPGAMLSAQQNPAIELYREGERLLADGQLYEAIDHFKESLVYNPEYVEPLQGLSEAYFKLEEYQQSLIYIRQARKLARVNYNIAALEGRIYTGLGRYEDAEALFTQLLEQQPYNREAVFGLAELHVAMGNIENALNSYRSALESDPYNRRGLLSAALLYAAQNNFEAAGELIQTAVDTYPEDPVVHAIGAEYYLQSGMEEKAESHAWQAVALDPENEDALAVLVQLLFRQERFTEAVDVVDRSIGLDRRNPLLWFLRGTAYWELDRNENALDSYYTALDLRPSDEIGRIVLEEFLLQEYLPESEERRRAAEVRFDRGSAYERDNRVELARQEYRRGLMLHPYNRNGRVLYANTYKRSGNIGKYLSILEVLEIDDNTTQDIRDEIEIYRNLRRDSIAAEWGVDQFAIERFRYRFALFTLNFDSSLIHLNAEERLSSYMQGLLRGFENIELVENRSVKNFAEAFRAARSEDADFFILLTYRETDRSFQVVSEVYNARTGSRVDTLRSIRTGNNRVTQSLVRIADGLADTLPVRGSIYRRSGNEVLVDIGEFQNVSEEQTLLVIRDEHLSLVNNSFRLEYEEENLLGEIVINAVDD